MSVEHKLIKCDEDDPRRCQASIKTGQCPFLSVEGFQYCQVHQGITKKLVKQEIIRNYRLQKWQNRVSEFADNDQVKSLREEIGILRMTLEEILVKCNDGGDLLLLSTKISDLVMKIEKLVSSCHRLELSTGTLLDKTTTIQMASVIVEILSKHITDSDILDQISDEIMVTIISTKSISVEKKNESS